MCVRSIFFFQAEDGIRDYKVTGVQTCALPISSRGGGGRPRARSARRAGGPDRPRGSARELGRARMVLGPPRGDRGGAEECARLRRAPPRGARPVLGRGATREGPGGWPRVGRKPAPAYG